MEKENVRKFNMIKITAIFFVVISLLIMIPSIIFNVLHNNDKIINVLENDKMKNLDDILSEKEKELERQFKHNYLVSYSHLIASNINSIYELYGNSGTEYTYEMIKKLSMDTFPFNKSDMKFIDKQVDKYLIEKYYLKFIQKEELKLKRSLKNK